MNVFAIVELKNKELSYMSEDTEKFTFGKFLIYFSDQSESITDSHSQYDLEPCADTLLLKVGVRNLLRLTG